MNQAASLSQQAQPQRPPIKPLAFDVAPLRAALAEYDATQPVRDAMCKALGYGVDHLSKEEANAAVQQQLVDYEKACSLALEKVQQAFWEVTKDRNSRESCSRIDVDFARRIAG